MFCPTRVRLFIGAANFDGPLNGRYFVANKVIASTKRHLANPAPTGKSDEVQLVTEFAVNFNKALDKSGYPSPTQQRAIRLAEAFEVSPAASRKWLTGSGLPSPATLKRIATTLGFSLDTVFGMPHQATGDGSDERAPVYYVAGNAKGRRYTAAAFEKGSYLSSPDHGGLLAEASFIVECWQRIRIYGLDCRRHEVFFGFDARVRSVEENNYYLLCRSDGTLFLAATRLAIDGTLLMGLGDFGDGPRYPEQHFIFNKSLLLEEAPPPSPGRLRVIGRLSGMLNLSF